MQWAFLSAIGARRVSPGTALMARKLGRFSTTADLDDGRTKSPGGRGSLSPGPSVRNSRVDRTGATVMSRFGASVTSRFAFRPVRQYRWISRTPLMKTVREYRQQADECRELAKRARSADEREAILAIAASWEKLAAARARKITKERPTLKAPPS
jgi:hypothetical protein